ncbi:MAG: peptidase domain-containing ABC transporter [Thalassospira sp.]|uniref:peptidase domain-containing ABC transporter n=1 Tax=Thalassospira sp. TaxID=1912094 RepID=UPI001B0C9474|nr:peptidase domain-containing ABC transporter [Thalassospira sp.]MBO6579896.1 peptidase domain-containing ABC transporter [Thalassospira sp.]MBO6818268.1 peptidase domain-containing ABC transporter [Thalassospira sp.]MBO6889344.1 peptidase domain-containing ABC transporter [Thalassospira sp.]
MMKKLENMDYAMNYRMGLESTDALSDFDACVWPLLQALGWRGLPRQVAEALPHMDQALDLTDFRNVMAHLNYQSREIDATLDLIDERLMPCLFVPDEGTALVVIRPEENGVRVFDGGTDREMVIRLSALPGKIYQFSAADRRERYLEDDKRGWFGGIADRFSGLLHQLLAMTFVLNILALATPIFVMGIYDRVIGTRSIPMLIQFSIGIGIVLILSWVLRTLRSQIVSHFGARLDTLVSGAIFERLLSLPPAFTERAPVGVQISRIRDFESVREFFTGPMALVIMEMPFVPLFLIVMFYLGGWLALIPIALIGVFALIGIVAFPIVARRVSELGRHGANRQEFLVETVGKMSALKYTASEQRWLARFRDISADTAYSGYRVAMVNNVINTLAQVLMITSGALVLAFGAQRVMEAQMSVGALVASMMLAWRVLGPINQAFLGMPRLAQLRGSVRQINRLMTIAPEGDLVPRSVEQHRFDGAVTFSRVSFRYSADSDPALVGVNFDIKPGQVVAVVGANGAGKSSLIKLIAGMYQPQAGAVLIDGADIRQMDPQTLRQAISYVPQDIEFFRGSIAQNLRLANPVATDDDLRMACMSAGILDDVEALPNGFKTRVGDQHSSRFSASFLQRLALARAFVREAPIILFDEATNGLDQRADRAFQSTINRLRGGSTIFLITHRPSHLDLADRILVLEGGQLRGDGPPARIKQQVIDGGYL